MSTLSGVFCDCTARPPWPRMMRLHTNVTSRYYLCRHCGTIREHICRPDGTILDTRLHHLGSADVPAAVVEQAREILNRPSYEQRSLFEG
jgi:hypothetical protein